MLRFFFRKQSSTQTHEVDVPYDQQRDPYLEQLALNLLLQEEERLAKITKQLEKESE